MSVLRSERDGGVALLTLNRPERLNALDRELLSALEEECAAIAADPAVRVAVVTGSGDRAFCAGADVNELDRISPSDAYELMRFGQGVFDRLESIPQPVVAAVNGVAFGGGCELALACDIRFAAEGARFGQPEIKLANVPGWGATQRLPRLIGAGRAAEMIFAGDPIDASVAVAWRLANRVLPREALLAESLRFAETLAARAALPLALAKEAMRFGREHGQAAGLIKEAEAVARCVGTEEQEAAVREFFAGRNRKSPVGSDGKGDTR
jgi:enoyl-CoA hydratase